MREAFPDLLPQLADAGTSNASRLASLSVPATRRSEYQQELRCPVPDGVGGEHGLPLEHEGGGPPAEASAIWPSRQVRGGIFTRCGVGSG